MIVPSDLGTAWSTMFQTWWLSEYNTSRTVDDATIGQLAIVQSMPNFTGNNVDLSWLGAAPQMREWVGEKQMIGIGKHTWAAIIKDYEATLEVQMNALLDARGNVYEPRIREMGVNAARLRWTLLSTLIKNGHTGLCYDGQGFFDTDHSEGDSGTQSNYLAASSGVTLAGLSTDFYAAVTALQGFKDDKGITIGGGNFRPLVVIPNDATLRQNFGLLKGASMISTTSNVLSGEFDLVVAPELTVATSWCVFRTDGPIKPFYINERQAPSYQDNFSSPASESMLLRGIGIATVEARYAATYAEWRKGVMVHA